MSGSATWAGWRFAAVVASIAVVASARTAAGQTAGNGFLFGEPAARVSVHGGFTHANASSDIFQQITSDFTLSKSDFSGFTLGGELALRISPKLDLAFALDYTGTNKSSEYRKFVDNNDLPIEQTTQLERVPITANMRLYLAPRGRSVGKLAWIPSTVVPWVGVGGGAIWYRFRQSGDFIFTQTSGVFSDKLESSGWGPAAQGMAGLDFNVSPRIAVTGDARYTWARASMSGDYLGFDKIDLSGVTLALGLTYRL